MRARRYLPILLVLALGLSACTGGEDEPTPEPPTSPTGSPSALPTRDTGRVEFERGAFRYAFNGVTARLRWEGGEGELTIDNGSGRELGPPSLYALTDDQSEVRAETRDAAPVPDGTEATFTIAFPDELTYERMGLIVLRFGDENWGAFAPVPLDEG